MYGEELSEDFKREYSETNLKAAKIGFVESMRAVAKSYLNGRGVPQDDLKALDWYINVDLMLSAVRCINSLVSEPGVVEPDFADVKSVLEKSGRGYVGYGKAKGEQPIIAAMKSAMNSLKDTLHNSKRFLICFFGRYENLLMLEVNEATTILQEAAHPDAELSWQVVPDITNQDFVEVIVISAE